MLVRKKRQVQKSFRIDEDVERDLGILAQLMERSQNDLANVALEELLQDNKYCFLNTVVLEHFKSEMERAEDELNPFEMSGLRVEVKYLENDRVSVRSIVSDEGKVVEDYTKEFESDISDEFEAYLMDLHVYVNPQAEDTIAYLEDRVDYRDYVKVRNKK